MLFTTTTIKDTTEGIEAFVSANLRAGADHMLLFIEGDEAASQASSFAHHPHVTAVPTGDRYWHTVNRRFNLNLRQVTNATLASTALAAIPWVDWLFHIDGDETLHLDRDHLLGLPPTVHAVHLRTLEAASDGSGDVRAFKEKLTAEQLRDLHARGLVSEPRNTSYLRGHLAGKAGARPSPFIRLGVHKARTHHGATLVHHQHTSLGVLHYEAVTPEAFIRKWTNLATAGAKHSPTRRVLADRVRAILSDGDATPAQKDARLREVYDECGRDDVSALKRLGLLVEPDPAWHQHTPTAMDTGQADLFRDVLELMLAADRRHFHPRYRRHHPIDVLRGAHSRCRGRRRRELSHHLTHALHR